jgi:uncharacterized protein YfiM (DUF2279 family)
VIGFCAVVTLLLACAPGAWPTVPAGPAHDAAAAGPAIADVGAPLPATGLSGDAAAAESAAGGAIAAGAAGVGTATARRRAGDAWLGEDKVRHLSMSYALVVFGTGAARGAGIDARPAEFAAVVGAAAAGVLKEVHDRARGGIFSYRDIAWNVAGIAAGILVVRSAQ